MADGGLAIFPRKKARKGILKQLYPPPCVAQFFCDNCPGGGGRSPAIVLRMKMSHSLFHSSFVPYLPMSCLCANHRSCVGGTLPQRVAPKPHPANKMFDQRGPPPPAVSAVRCQPLGVGCAYCHILAHFLCTLSHSHSWFVHVFVFAPFFLHTFLIPRTFWHFPGLFAHYLGLHQLPPAQVLLCRPRWWKESPPGPWVYGPDPSLPGDCPFSPGQEPPHPTAVMRQ